MLLHYRMVARLPVTSLPSCCTCVRATSISHAQALFERYQRPITTKPLGAVAWLRGSKDWQEAEEVKGARSRHAEESGSKSRSDGGEQPIKPVSSSPTPNKKKLFVVAVLISFAVTSFLFTTLIASDAAAEDAIPRDAPHVDFSTFVQKYLKAGEIQKVTFIVGKEKAVCTLHAGAIIDGKPATSGHVVIDYPHPPQQFWADVRKVEAEMGISLAQGVNIQLLNPTSGWRMLEFFLGCFIIGWLCTQYGRLILKRVAEQRAKQGKM